MVFEHNATFTVLFIDIEPDTNGPQYSFKLEYKDYDDEFSFKFAKFTYEMHYLFHGSMINDYVHNFLNEINIKLADNFDVNVLIDESYSKSKSISVECKILKGKKDESHEDSN